VDWIWPGMAKILSRKDLFAKYYGIWVTSRASFLDFIIVKSPSTLRRFVILDIVLRHPNGICFFPPRLHSARFEILSQGCPSQTQPEENSKILWKTEAEDSEPVEEPRFQRRVKRPWRNEALAPVGLHPAGTLNSPTKTHTLPRSSPDSGNIGQQKGFKSCVVGHVQKT
jgi:hypothetical protein